MFVRRIDDSSNPNERLGSRGAPPAVACLLAMILRRSRLAHPVGARGHGVKQRHAGLLPHAQRDTRSSRRPGRAARRRARATRPLRDRRSRREGRRSLAIAVLRRVRPGRRRTVAASQGRFQGAPSSSSRSSPSRARRSNRHRRIGSRYRMVGGRTDDARTFGIAG